MAIRDELLATAQEYSDEIGVANYIATQYLGKKTTPGDIIIMAARFDTEGMAERNNALRGLLDVYGEVASPYAIEIVEDTWKGDHNSGSHAFISRWKGLCEHIAGTSGVNLEVFLKEMTDDMNALIGNAEEFQRQCKTNIETHFPNLRDLYIDALIKTAQGRYDDLGSAIMNYSGYGATVGSAGGTLGTIVGTFVGVAVGVVDTFSKDTADAAKENLNLTTPDDLDEELQAVHSLFSTILVSGNYGTDGGVTKYSPDGGDIMGVWEPVE